MPKQKNPSKSAEKAPKAAEKSAGKHAPSLISQNTVFTLEIPWEQVEQAWQQALLTAQQQLKLDGFRQGKVPLKLVEQNVDRNFLIQKTVEALLPAAYQKYIQEHNLTPLTEPDISAKSLNQGEPWQFEVAIAQKPDVDLKGYEKIVTETKKKHELWQEKKSSKKQTEEGKPELTEDQRKQARLEALLAAILEKIQISVPELLLRRETEHQLHRLEHELQHLGMSVDEFLKRSQKSLQDLQQDYAARSLGNLQVELFLGALIREQDITVEPDEVAAELKRLHPTEEKGEPPQIRPEEASYVQSVLLKKKALDHLLNL